MPPQDCSGNPWSVRRAPRGVATFPCNQPAGLWCFQVTGAARKVARGGHREGAEGVASETTANPTAVWTCVKRPRWGNKVTPPGEQTARRTTLSDSAIRSRPWGGGVAMWIRENISWEAAGKRQEKGHRAVDTWSDARCSCSCVQS